MNAGINSKMIHWIIFSYAWQRKNNPQIISSYAQKKYPVYTKSVYSSFAIPQVRELAKHASHVVISGVVAECCVLSTALSAIDAGCKVIYLTDAVAGLNATSQKEAENILSYLSPLHTKLMTTQQYLDSLLQEE